MTRPAKMKHLLASSNTLDGIQSLVDKFFAGEHKPLVSIAIAPDLWHITRAAGTPIDNIQVRKSGKRYRFEMN